MAYYDFPHTRNYDTDLGYLIEKYQNLQSDFDKADLNNIATTMNNLTKSVDSLDTRVTNNESDIATDKGNISTNTTNIAFNKSAITELQKDVTTLASAEQESKTDITDLKDRTTQLETNEKEYLKDVELVSNDITINSKTKADGTETINLTVKSSTPAELAQNLEYANTNNSDIVTATKDGVVSATEDSIKVTQDVEKIKDGNGTTETNTLAEFSVNNFEVTDGKVDLKLDLDTINEEVETLQTSLATTNSNVTNNSTAISELDNKFDGTLIPSGTDLNTITEVGNYYCGVDMNYVNTPSGQENKWCSLEVRQASNEDYVTQVWWSMDKETHTKGESYYRLVKVSEPSGTYEWVQMVSATDLKTINNESLLGGGNLNIKNGITYELIYDTLSNLTTSRSITISQDITNYDRIEVVWRTDTNRDNVAVYDVSDELNQSTHKGAYNHNEYVGGSWYTLYTSLSNVTSSSFTLSCYFTTFTTIEIVHIYGIHFNL